MTLPFDTLDQLRLELSQNYPTFGAVDEISSAEWESFGDKGDISNEPLINPIENYYMTDSISRASKTMAECSAAIITPETQRTGSDG